MLSFGLELCEVGIVLSLNLSLHLGKLYLVVVFSLGDFILKQFALLVPFEQLKLVEHFLLFNLFHRQEVFVDLVQFHVALFEFILAKLVDLIHLVLHLLGSVVHGLLVLLLELQDPISQRQLSLHQVRIVVGQLLDNCLLILDLGLKLLGKADVLAPNFGDVFILVVD